MSSLVSAPVPVSAPGVDPAERVGAVSARRRPPQHPAAPAASPVDQHEPGGPEALQDAEPIPEHFLVRPGHLEPGPLQVDRGDQVADALQGPGFDPVLENPPLGAEQVRVKEVDLKREQKSVFVDGSPVAR